MSKHKEQYDPRKDPSLKDQGEISPSNPYDPGPRPPRDAPLAFPQPRERLSGARLFFRKLFFGNTTPGTNAGNRTAFKRGLIFAMLIGLIIATPFAIAGLVKGTTVLAVALPTLMVALGCVFVAGIAMCIYSCCVRACNSRRRTTSFDEVYDSRSFEGTELTSETDRDVAQFADARNSSAYGQTHSTFGRPLPGYSLQSDTAGFGDDVVVENGFEF